MVPCGNAIACGSNAMDDALQDAQKARPARPQRVKTLNVPLGYVEGLNDARTPLAGFFSILLISVAKGWEGLNCGSLVGTD